MKLSITLAALLAAAQADSSASFSMSPYDLTELSVLFQDIGENEMEYMTYLADTPGFTPPAGFMDIFYQYLTYADDSYTTLFETIAETEFDAINGMVTALPWYSTRLMPELTAAIPVTTTQTSSASSAVDPSSSSTFSMSCEDVQELYALVQDVAVNEDEYISYLEDNSGVVVPDGMISLVEEVLTYTDDSYTTQFATLDESVFSLIQSQITELPWYTTRLYPMITSDGAGACTASSQSSAVQSTTSSTASSTFSMSCEDVQELYALVQDVAVNEDEYISYLEDTSGVVVPDGMISLVEEVLTYTDDSYTTQFATLDESVFSLIQSQITELPWYTTRLYPMITSDGAGACTASSQSSAAPTISSSSSSSSSSPSTPANLTLSCQDVQEIYALLQDIEVNEMEYLNYLSDTPGVTIPDGLIDLFEEVMTYTDDSYTTLFETMPESVFDQINGLVTDLPWYTTRLYPMITSDGAGACTATSQSSAAPTISSSSSSSSASSTFSMSCEDVQEIYALLQDIEANEMEYLNYLEDTPSVTIPDGMISLVEDVITYTDDSYTTLFETIDESVFDQINLLVTALPWYTTRLYPAITSDGAGACTASSQSSQAPTTSITSSSSSTTSFSSSSTTSSSSSSSVTSATSLSCNDFQEVYALLEDFENNQMQYVSYLGEPGIIMPEDLLVLFEDVMGYTDDSFTTLFETMSASVFDAIDSVVTGLPWYSTRLYGEITSDVAVCTATSQSSAAPTISSSSSSSSASSTFSMSCEDVQEMHALVQDIEANQVEYLNYLEDTPSVTVPDGMIKLVENVYTYTDDSYTTLFETIDESVFDQVNVLLTALPWYATRLYPIITSDDASACTASSQSSAAPTISSSSSSSLSSSSSASSASSTFSMSCEDVQEIYALLQDIEFNEMEYLNYLEDTPSVTIPDGMISLVEEVMTYTDDSYTTLFETIDESVFDQINGLVTALPWYATRLYPMITSDGAGACTASSQSSGAPTISSSTSSGVSSPSSQGVSSTSSSSTSITSSSLTTSSPSPSSFSMSCSDVQEIYALFKDISVNEGEYLSYLSGTPGLVIPDGLMELFEEVMTYTDDSFSTLFSTMAESEYDQIDDMITALPWYSTRLLPEITADDGVCTSSGSGVTTGTSGTVSQTSSTSNVSGTDTTTTYETITTTISDKTTTYVTTYCPKCQSSGSVSDTTYETITTTISDETTTYVTTYCPKCQSTGSVSATTYETITTTISDETTTYVTTYCPKCHASSSLAGGETVVTTISDETTTYVTTYCPEGKSSSSSPEETILTTTISDETTTYVTTYCPEGKSSLSPEETTVKTIIQGYTTVVTTYCPKCTSKTSATASGSASSLPTAQKVSTFEASANSIKTPGSVLAGVIFLLYLLH